MAVYRELHTRLTNMLNALEKYRVVELAVYRENVTKVQNRLRFLIEHCSKVEEKVHIDRCKNIALQRGLLSGIRDTNGLQVSDYLDRLFAQ